jgi:cystathionine beta-synthase
MNISQIPVTSDKRIIGSLSENHILKNLMKNLDVKDQIVETIMEPAFPFVDISTPIDALNKMITSDNSALLVRDFKTDKTYILTKSDLISVMAS